MRQPKWDKYEVVLLIDGYWKIKAGYAQKKEIVAELSSFLRERADFEFNDTFLTYNCHGY